MTNRTKVAAGVSGTVVLIWILHAVHIISFVTSKGPTPDFKNSKAFIILIDSGGKNDTMPLEDYLDSLQKKRKENHR